MCRDIIHSVRARGPAYSRAMGSLPCLRKSSLRASPSRDCTVRSCMTPSRRSWRWTAGEKWPAMVTLPGPRLRVARGEAGVPASGRGSTSVKGCQSQPSRSPMRWRSQAPKARISPAALLRGYASATERPKGRQCAKAARAPMRAGAASARSVVLPRGGTWFSTTAKGSEARAQRRAVESRAAMSNSPGRSGTRARSAARAAASAADSECGGGIDHDEARAGAARGGKGSLEAGSGHCPHERGAPPPVAPEGGTGKTTLAVHVAADFEGAGGSAALHGWPGPAHLPTEQAAERRAGGRADDLVATLAGALSPERLQGVLLNRVADLVAQHHGQLGLVSTCSSMPVVR